MITAEEVFAYALHREWQWNIDGELRTPALEHIEEALYSLSKSLDEKPEASQASLGQILMIREGNKDYIFVYLGEHNAS